MKPYEEFFKGKRITLLGLGLLGRGVGDVEFLAKCGAEVLVTDKKSDKELAESVTKLKKYPNVTFHLGGHQKEDFSTGGGSAFGGRKCDLVIKSAGVRLDSQEIAAARAAGVPVVMSTALFAKFGMEAGAKIVGVTGTRGKSTVSHMIYHSLIRANRQTILGGNVRGVSTLAMLPEINAGDIAVLELDSWQLQGFGDLEISPHVAVFTNLMPDHQNYYKNMDEYFADKANIFRYQKSDDVLIAGGDIADRIREARPPLDPVVPERIPSDWKLKIVGEHNRENASFANAALQALGLSEEEIKAGLESFEGVEGRLQFLGEVKGVKVYNDNSATTQEATIAALRAVGDKKERKVVLIMGGDDKSLDMSRLIDEIPKWCSKVVLFKERGTDRIRESVFALESTVRVYEEEGLQATVERAFAVANPGETILYSPAFSSFGKYFKNEFDRGDQFVALVRQMEAAA